jgi:Fur family zinc uptake transcriptional regulator
VPPVFSYYGSSDPNNTAIKMSQHNAITRAKKFCETHKYRFTEPRRRVLSLLVSENVAMGAYEVLEALSSDKERLSPPTVYRAIDFWNKNGFIHRIESMNAYIACCEHSHHKNFCIFICKLCNTVMELKLPHLPAPITRVLENNDLTMAHSTTEIYGKCSRCG